METDARLAIASIPEGESDRSFEVSAGEIGLDPESLSGALRVDLTISRSEDRFHITGSLSGTAVEGCSRCDVRFERSVESDLMLIANRESEGTTIEDVGDDEDFLLHQGDELDLRETLRQLVVLSAPMAPVCREDCKGLCPQCGVDRNESTCDCSSDRPDPRWQVLDDVLRKSKPDSGD